MFGDVVLCRFPFTSGVAAKVRPALVLFDLSHDLIVCRITSAPAVDPLDVTVDHWQAAGLNQRSTVRLNRIVTIERSIVLRKLGTLDSADQAHVRQAWNQSMRL
jgi:mRNA interferase MazF